VGDEVMQGFGDWQWLSLVVCEVCELYGGVWVCNGELHWLKWWWCREVCSSVMMFASLNDVGWFGYEAVW
jgi:hypothetical protein